MEEEQVEEKDNLEKELVEKKDGLETVRTRKRQLQEVEDEEKKDTNSYKKKLNRVVENRFQIL